LLRADVALHAVLGSRAFLSMTPFATCSKRFGQGQCQRFFSACGVGSWKAPGCSAGYSLDLDSTVFERYGRQPGALRDESTQAWAALHHPLWRCWPRRLSVARWLRAELWHARGWWNFSRRLWHCCRKHALRVVRATPLF